MSPPLAVRPWLVQYEFSFSAKTIFSFSADVLLEHLRQTDPQHFAVRCRQFTICYVKILRNV